MATDPYAEPALVGFVSPSELELMILPVESAYTGSQPLDVLLMWGQSSSQRGCASPHSHAAAPNGGLVQVPIRTQHRDGYLSRDIPVSSAARPLQQRRYTRGIVSATRNLSLKYNNFSLRSALSEGFGELDDPSGQAFPADVKLAQKVSVRFLFEGHPDYAHQTNILRVNNQRPTRGQLATAIAREAKRFLEHETRTGNPLMYNGEEVTFDELVLEEVQHASRGSIQPILAVIA